jgi:hypothetical protein
MSWLSFVLLAFVLYRRILSHGLAIFGGKVTDILEEMDEVMA